MTAVRVLSMPKGVLTAALVTLLVIAGRVAGPTLVMPRVAAAVLAAVVIDMPVLRWRSGRWRYPAGGVLTALLVSAVVSIVESWYVFAAATAIGLAGKHVLRTRHGHVFNPAALGLVAVSYLFDAAQDWWGALTFIVPGAAVPLVGAAALIVAHRVGKLPLLLAFLIAIFGVSSVSTFVVDPGEVAEVFVWPDLLAIVFAAGVFITDPPTSPPRHREQIRLGAAIGGTAAILLLTAGRADYVLEAVIVGNAIEAMRRSQALRRALRVRESAARVRPWPA